MSTASGSPDVVIGEAAFGIIAHHFNKVRAGERPCFRLNNLTNAEILSFLSVWKARVEGTPLEVVRVVVSAEAGDDFPEDCRAAPDHSITFYRNNNKEGLVYVETRVESDAQGLKNLFTLRDNNFLDGSFDDEDLHVPEIIVEFAWSSLGGNPEAMPRLLAQRLVDVLQRIHPEHKPVSVRKFAQFVLSACRDWNARPGSTGTEETDRLVGRVLTELDLFPDEEWRAAGTEQRITRRLALNACHAELSSSPTTDLDPEALADQCRRVCFTDEDGVEYPSEDQQHWRTLCAQYCLNQAGDTRGQIPYRIFEQLFSKDVKGLGLGERVEQEILDKEPARVREYHDLDVKDGLTRRIQEDAQKFLETEPVVEENERSVLEEGAPDALRDLLTRQTRRMVEKVAYPAPERFENPFTTIADIASTLRDRNRDRTGRLRLQMALGREANANSASLGLFAFLYAATLSSVVEQCGLGSQGVELSIDERLLERRQPPQAGIDQGDQDDQNDDAETVGVDWRPIPIEFHLLSMEDGREVDAETGFEWLPVDHERLCLLWYLLAAQDRPDWHALLAIPDETTIGSWAQQVAEREMSISSAISGQLSSDIVADPRLRRLGDLKEELVLDACTNGLSSELLETTFSRWVELCEQVKRELVPDGIVDARLQAFLSFDTMAMGDGRALLMLPTHPFRLRWLARYLRHSEELAVNALGDELRLNQQNSNLYLDWIAELSPHQHPPIACNGKRGLALAVGEIGWGEEFLPCEGDHSRRSQSTVDAASVSEIADQVVTYLEAHPYKRDGLSLLLVLPRGGTLATDLVKSIRKNDWKDTVIYVHVMSPLEHWEAMAREFESLPSENRMAIDGVTLFPPVQLEFHEWGSTVSVDEALGDLQVDISIVPQFLNDHVDVQQNTEPSIEREGRFDALLDKTTHVYGGAHGGSIAVSLRPRAPDPALETWSTLVVRQHRLRPVAPQQPDNTDFVELRISFEETALLFDVLHRHAHWVVTLERHITRQQIETLESTPDILTIREGVGAGGLYTIIVSSNSGRKFIVDRLERKLQRIVDRGGGDSQAVVSTELAARVYDETRTIAPKLALQAMGLSRVTEEILGLMMARRMARKHYPVDPADGVVVWISFDEHPEWFRGSSAVRADLCRIALGREDGGVVADFLVLEGKLRQAYDKHGVSQVASTMSLLRDVAPTSDGGQPPIDARLWREHILMAMENVHPNARSARGPAAEELEGERYRLPEAIRQAFREGMFRMRSLHGLFSICLHDQRGDLVTSMEEDGSVLVVRSFGNHVLDLLGGADPSGEGDDVEPDFDAEPCEPRETDRGPVQPGNLDLVPPDPPVAGRRGKLSPEEMAVRYQGVLDKLGEFNVPVEPPEDETHRFVEGPASILFRVRPGPGIDPRRIFEKSDALKLALALEDAQSIRFGIDRGFVTIDVPKSDEDRYFVAAADVWSRWTRPTDELAVPLGEDRNAELVVLTFSSPNSPHLLIGGTTGSGKSEALNTIICGLTKYYSPAELRLLLIDPKGTELLPFKEDPHLEGEIGWDDADALSLVRKAVEEMQARYQRFRAVSERSLAGHNRQVPPDQRIPWWVIVLDEYADLTSEPETKKEIEKHLKRLAQKARAAGIHVLIATQKPSAEVISTNLRSNLPAQLALRVRSATESRVIMDEAGAETLNGKGDAFLRADGRLQRVQCGKV